MQTARDPDELGASGSYALTREGPCGHLAMSGWPARGASSWRTGDLGIASVTLPRPAQPAVKVLSKSHHGAEPGVVKKPWSPVHTVLTAPLLSDPCSALQCLAG